MKLEREMEDEQEEKDGTSYMEMGMMEVMGVMAIEEIPLVMTEYKLIINLSSSFTYLRG